MARTTSREKIALIEQFGGSCHLLVDHASEVYEAAEQLAGRTNGHYMDQFTYAERATDWRGNNNIAESIFEPAGPGGAPDPSLDRGGRRHRRHQRHHRPLPPLPPPHHGARRRRPGELSVLPRRLASRRAAGQPTRPWPLDVPSRIEGIGRARLEPSFVPVVIDHMVHGPGRGFGGGHAPSAATTPACHAGPSTGTNLWGVWQLIAEMHRQRAAAAVLSSLICDGGDRYAGELLQPGVAAVPGPGSRTARSDHP